MIIIGYFGVNLGGSGEISGPLLEKKFGLWPTFEMGWGDFWSSCTDEIAFWPTFCGFWPTFKNETGPEKTQCLCGFAGFWPTFPHIFLFKYDKKLINIYK